MRMTTEPIAVVRHDAILDDEGIVPLTVMHDRTDTETVSECNTTDIMNTPYCVITATDITIDANVTVRGEGLKPLLFLATDKFDLQGTIDVSTKHGATPGAGALAATDPICAGATVATQSGGGFGGGLGGHGGAGGNVDAGGGVEAQHPFPLPIQLTGGCPGGDGAPTGAGIGGKGGGAVAIVAHQMTLNGVINASGAAGTGGGAQTAGGGGGGGSGGMIVLDAPTITPGTAQMI
jgi:hypothetical protein